MSAPYAFVNSGFIDKMKIQDSLGNLHSVKICPETVVQHLPNCPRSACLISLSAGLASPSSGCEGLTVPCLVPLIDHPHRPPGYTRFLPGSLCNREYMGEHSGTTAALHPSEVYCKSRSGDIGAWQP